MIASALVVLLLAGGLAHLLPRTKLTPPGAVILWMAVLCLRAVAVAFVALLVVAYFPATQLFELATGWCIHTAVPFIATHLGLSGHRIGELAILIPTLALALSLIAALFGLWRASRGVSCWLSGTGLASGPRQSLVIGDPEIVLAAAGLRGPRIVISTGALTALDDDELTAGLEHEQGHIDRRHSYILLAAHLLFGLARLAPGSRRALRELQFHLERDADEYAVSRTRNPAALAATICKAAGSSSQGSHPALASLSGADTPTRLRLLLDRGAAEPDGVVNGLAVVIAVALFVAALALGAAVPEVARAGVGHAADAVLYCR